MELEIQSCVVFNIVASPGLCVVENSRRIFNLIYLLIR